LHCRKVVQLPELDSDHRRDFGPRQAFISVFKESHNDDVTELKWHPTQTQTLLSGSTDGLVNIFDTGLRAGPMAVESKPITDEDDALMQVINHGSINRAGFLVTDGGGVFVASHDETFSIYPRVDSQVQDENEAVVDEDDATVSFGDLRSRLDCEYIIDVCPMSDGAVIGVGKHRY